MEVQRTVPAFPRKEKLKMRKVVLLTGGTGFLGTLLAARLVRDPEITTYVLVRAADEEEAA